MFSVLDMFTIGVGPSSSHTVGPMCAAQAFASSLEESGAVSRVGRIRVVLYGSLSLTGLGHGTDRAILAGLEGNVPATVDTDYLLSVRERCAHDGTIHVNGTNAIAYDDDGDMVFDRWKRLAPHPNGMRFQAFDAQGNIIDEQVWYSIGGGFIRRGRIDDALISNHEQTPASSQSPEDSGNDEAAEYGDGVPYPFVSCDGLIDLCRKHHLSIADVVWANETARRSPQEVRDRLTRIWNVMSHCIDAGCASATPTLPGGLDVPRRAPLMYRRLAANSDVLRRDRRISSALESSDSAWVALFAMSVSEENAGGGVVVTAPTCGASGVLPAVLVFKQEQLGFSDRDMLHALAAAGIVGNIIKTNASISGAECGCQAEIGSACSMAAAGLAELYHMDLDQIEYAAEVAMEHHLGLTCDPIGGLVQIPCIERNAVAAMRAINALSLANFLTYTRKISFDMVVKTMYETGRDLFSKYRETSEGGLAKMYRE